MLCLKNNDAIFKKRSVLGAKNRPISHTIAVLAAKGNKKLKKIFVLCH
jgi:hypothetical protein